MKILKALDMAFNKIINLGAPTSDNDASTKKYVDDGLNTKAASSHNHNNTTPYTAYTWKNSWSPRDYPSGVSCCFVQSADGFPNYGTVLTVRGYTSSQDGGVLQIYTPYNSSYGGDRIKYRMGKYNNAGWTAWKEVLDKDYADTLYALASHTHDSRYYTESEINSNFLKKTNTTIFIPTADYHPATKKYVDDNAGGGSTGGWKHIGSYTTDGDNNITIPDGAKSVRLVGRLVDSASTDAYLRVNGKTTTYNYSWIDLGDSTPAGGSSSSTSGFHVGDCDGGDCSIDITVSATEGGDFIYSGTLNMSGYPRVYHGHNFSGATSITSVELYGPSYDSGTSIDIWALYN